MKKFYALAAVAMAAMTTNAQLYVCGGGDGLAWSPESPRVIEAAADGTYTFTVNNLVEMKLSTTFGDWDTFNKGALWIDTSQASLGQETKFYGGDGNIYAPWKGDYTFVIKFAEVPDDAYAKGWAKVTTTTPKPDAVIQDVYIRGDMNGWGAADDWKFTSVDGVNYTFECKGDTKILANQNFKIADASWGAVNYGGNGKAAVNTDLTWYHNANDSWLANDFEGTVYVVLGEARGPITVNFATRSSGIIPAVTDSEGAQPEYYTLQGVRMANPENGVYIVRQGGKVSKIIR